MATNLNINQELLEEALKIGGQKTKKSTVNKALKEFIEKRKQIEIISMFGSIVYEAGHNYKDSRSSEYSGGYFKSIALTKKRRVISRRSNTESTDRRWVGKDNWTHQTGVIVRYS